MAGNDLEIAMDEIFEETSTASPNLTGGVARKQSARLRELFARPGALRIVGAHNPLGARLAERAGFDGVWSSGLEVSASQGLPDTDLMTMTDLLAVAGSMAAAVDIPVVADCDAGYGNALNVMHMIRRYEAAGVAAVCIEDKRFPKVNSFIPGRQVLESVEVFAAKVAAAKAAQRDPNLMVIARTEALIAGWGMDEALTRADAYAAAGADAILIHAKGSSPEPVLEFLDRWSGQLPVVVVPTTYHTITFDELAEAGAKLVIYANHGLRAGITAVSEVFEAILDEGRTTGIEARIAPLATVFDLQGMDRIKESEARFVPAPTAPHAAVVLPAPPGPPDVRPAVDGRVGALRARGVQTVLIPVGTAGHDAEAVAATDPGGHCRVVVVGGTEPPEDGTLHRLLTESADIATAGDSLAALSGPAYSALREVAGKRIADGQPDTALHALIGDLADTGWTAVDVTAARAGSTTAGADA
ncbi:isocitrate lyase/phosphoenolpyruvate mutase family protein [Streptomyces sp. TRM76323]|uniref:Isocitrate lyase/phosphoenolpyruvate mutase family protein n=1 Tax=Streptomyces tamarix TaxID=3078565 RepID=A0ABU3QI18_9ACTN|nr:isocitrate lyase/phosphoenolpyruvate mutase family protein [Streptomyces tamarix]MDT9682410.1 isocitrate lyase/phosphoenolpyruvate mutase family protein [Streptomyces tamarix]